MLLLCFYYPSRPDERRGLAHTCYVCLSVCASPMFACRTFLPDAVDDRPTQFRAEIKGNKQKRGRTKSFADQQELNELPFSLPIPIRNGGMCIVCGQQRRKPYKRRIEGGLLLFTQEESESLPLSVRSIPFTRLLLPMFPDKKGELRRSKVLPSPP